MKAFFNEYIGSMDFFRATAGMLTEDEIATRVAHSGDVPTAGVNKDNKMPAGSAGLQGQSLQPVEPEGVDDEDVGDNEEQTLDQAIAMLKKEGIDTDGLWITFLENNGISPADFDQMMTMAMKSQDPEEMDQIIAVENIFYQSLPAMIQEAFGDFFRKKKQATDPLAAVKRAGEVIRKHGAAGVRAANAHGVSPDHVVSLDKPKSAKPEIVHKQDFSQGTRSTRSVSPTRKMSVGESKGKSFTFKAHHNPKTGEPMMPWHSAMEGIAGKYNIISEKYFIAQATKHKGTLHKRLGVPQDKKIPAAMLNKAAHAGGKLGKEANLAKTLKKLHKK